MRTSLRLLSALFALAYALDVGSPCAGDPTASAGGHAHHHGDHGHHGSHHAMSGEDAPPCHAAPPQMTAACPCGCAKRDKGATSSIGVQLALEPEPLETPPAASACRSCAPPRLLVERAPEPRVPVPKPLA